MMRARIAFFVAVAWALQTGASYAQYDWDWYDKMSGPGYFRNDFDLPRIGYRFLCISDQSSAVLRAGERAKFPGLLHPLNKGAGLLPIVGSQDRDTLIGTLNRAQTDQERKVARRQLAVADCNSDLTRHYLTAYYHFQRSHNNDLALLDPESDTYQVKAHMFGLEYSHRLGKAFDLSSGIEVRKYSGDAFNSFSKWSLNVVSYDFAPFALGKNNDSQAGRALKLRFAITMFVNDLHGSDFCTKAEFCGPTQFDTSFERRRDTVPHVAVIFNPGFLGPFRRK